MTDADSKDQWTIVVGVVGLMTILLIAIGYAYWDSGTHFRPDKVNRFVIEQTSVDER